jgi:tyrosyl-tRNA synthetase
MVKQQAVEEAEEEKIESKKSMKANEEEENRDRLLRKAQFMKMSKSDPSSAIFMDDTEEEVSEKLRLAFCPMEEVKENPCIQYVRHIVFGRFKEFVVIHKTKKEGGEGEVSESMVFSSPEEVERAWIRDFFSPKELKTALAGAINTILKPIRDHFKNNAEAKELGELVRSFRVKKDQQQSD